VDGLSALSSVGNHLIVILNAVLTNIDGLSAVSHVGGSLIIQLNPLLPNVDALQSIKQVGLGLNVISNDSLTSLDGLAAITGVGKELVVQSNPELADCSGLHRLLDLFDDAQAGPGSGAVPDIGGDVIIGNNLAGCNSRLEILYGEGAPEDPFLAVPVFNSLSVALLTGLMLLTAVIRLRRKGYK
jgi:hypothetical protein